MSEGNGPAGGPVARDEPVGQRATNGLVTASIADRRGGGERFLLVAACVVVVIAGLRAAAALLLPFVLALFLAVLSLPLLNWLQRRRVPASIAVLLTILADLAVVFLIALLVSGSIQGFIDDAPRYKERLDAMSASLTAWLQSSGVDTSQLLPELRFKPGALFDIATGTLRGAAKVLSNTLLVILTVVFILFEAVGFPAKLGRAMGIGGETLSRYTRMTSEVQRYLGIKTVISLGTGVLAGVWVAVLGVDFPVLWGLVAFLLNYVPNLGSIIAAVPPVLLAVIQYGPGRALVVAIGSAAINTVIGNLVEPNLMGRRLGLSTLVVFLSLVFWGWIWGPVGMLLSVPLTMVVKIMLENTEDLSWVAVLLDASTGPPGPNEPPGAS